MEELEQDSTNDKLYGLDSWVDFLCDKTSPVRNRILVRMGRALDSDRTTMADLSVLVRSDPSLAFHIICAAQEIHSQKGKTVTSIDHAIASLGFDQLYRLSRKIETIKLHAHNMAQKSYFRAIADSQHAATQAATWAQMKKLGSAEEIRLAALLYGMVHWMLWLHAPLHKDMFLTLVNENGIAPVEAERRIFGCSTQEIGGALAQVWDLPPLTLQALDHETSPSLSMLKQLHLKALGDPRLERDELRQLNHLLQQHYYPVKLANWLALTVSRGWDSKRADRTYAFIGDYLNIQPQDIRPLLHKTCAVAAREYHVPGTLTPAAELLFLPSNTELPYALTEQERAVYENRFPIPELPPEEPDPDELALEPQEIKPTLAQAHIYEQIMHRLLKGYDLYTKPAHILQGLMQGIGEGLGLERLALALYRPNEQKILTVKVIGFGESDAIASMNTNANNPLMERMLRKPVCVWINDENRRQLSPHLPREIRTIQPLHDCMLMSVFKDQQPVAIVYADRGPDAEPIDAFYHERFRYLCSAASLALKQLASSSS